MSNSGDVSDKLSLTTCLSVDTTGSSLRTACSGANEPYNRHRLYMQRNDILVRMAFLVDRSQVKPHPYESTY